MRDPGMMDSLSIFGLCAVSLMLLTYALEERSPLFTLAFAGSCALGSTYGFLQGAWPFGLVEGIWSIVAVRKWLTRRRQTRLPEAAGVDFIPENGAGPLARLRKRLAIIPSQLDRRPTSSRRWTPRWRSTGQRSDELLRLGEALSGELARELAWLPQEVT